MKLYPLKFKSIYFEKVWGGRDLESLRNDLPNGEIGESWDVSFHDNAISEVENGELKGKSLKDVIDDYKEDVVGSKIYGSRFPLLVKLINSKEKLSVQVHPNDDYAIKNENDFGKTEMWYVVDAKEGAYIITGLEGIKNKEELKKHIEDKTLENFLEKRYIKKGDSFLIKSGTVHAICEGMIIAEIQQNSDVTYRLWDYGRPREIHVDKALDTIEINQTAITPKDEVKDINGVKRQDLTENEYFTIEKIILDKNNNLKDNGDKERFNIITCVDGEGIIAYQYTNYTLKKGDSYMIPASIGEYELTGDLTLLKTVPLKTMTLK